MQYWIVYIALSKTYRIFFFVACECVTIISGIEQLSHVKLASSIGIMSVLSDLIESIGSPALRMFPCILFDLVPIAGT